MTFVIPYPMIDPVLLQFGPVAIRWYSLAYIAGLLLAWRYMRALAKHPPQPASAADLDDFLVWATLGVILGGRLGYVIFYKPEFYLDNPLAILQVWRGGMSFHGGLLGVLVAGILFARRRSIAYLPFAHLLACAAPIGLSLGRLAHFVHAERLRRATELPRATVLPRGGA